MAKSQLRHECESLATSSLLRERRLRPKKLISLPERSVSLSRKALRAQLCVIYDESHLINECESHTSFVSACSARAGDQGTTNAARAVVICLGNDVSGTIVSSAMMIGSALLRMLTCPLFRQINAFPANASDCSNRGQDDLPDLSSTVRKAAQ
jgi:hypothetical protein